MDTPKMPETAINLQLLGIVSQLYSARMEARLAPQGLTLAQFSVLMHLSRSGRAQRISDIARAMGANQPAITKTIAKFESLGVVDTGSDPLDKRSRLVTVNDRGRAMLQSIRTSLAEEPVAVFDGWKDKDIARLQKYLARLAQWYDANRL